jgi:twitching motility protein PilJ
MDTIREQIQDTSKRIKRLGESSQEIGDIVSLISDIADQTNILALNAAIQASMAGDAGRGFAVVADEVQRLAERSAGAAKQVATLVKAIQSDTNEAVSSMEQTTSEVVSGAKLAHDAGAALGEIQTVSASLAELIQDMSLAARQQANTAGEISKTMNVIQDITSQTTAGTRNTATSTGELAKMAVELREFVADFKLPASAAYEHVSDADDEYMSFEEEVAEAETEEFYPSEEEPESADEDEYEMAATESGELEGFDDAQSDDIPAEDFELQPAAAEKPAVSELEEELAGVDLDEFSIDEPQR